MKQIIDEGTWFAIPLRSKGFAVGVVARASPGGGVILAYFFKKVWDHPPQFEEVNGFKPDDAVRILRVGDLGFLDGTWPVLGRDPDWNRGSWTIPHFVRKDDISRKAWIVVYSDHDPNRVESETRASYDVNLERDSMFGAGAAEIDLTRILS
jgi:Immunity protein 26